MKNVERHFKSYHYCWWTVCLLVTFTLNFAYAHPWPGSGTAGDPFLISDANGMQAIGADANYWSSCFKLVNDIDMSQFTGLQYNIPGYLAGIFDGNSHTIYNFTYESNGVDSIGLFASLSGKISNLNLVNVNVNAGTGSGVGSIAGAMGYSTEISNCFVRYGNISGDSNVGGLVGKGSAGCSGILDCIVSDVSITGSQRIGGIIGSTGGAVEDCSTKVSIHGNGNEIMFAGGICGELYTYTKSGCPSISGCWSHCDITIFEPNWVIGGGGILGIGHGAFGGVSESYAEGMIYGPASGIIGGLVGFLYNNFSITNSYSTTTMYGGSDVGGLIGYNSGYVYRCFSAGQVSSQNYPYDLYVYGFVGHDGGGTYTRCFWDTDINPPGMGSGTTSSEVVGKTTAEMKTKSTFTDAGWDFNDVWAICESTNYPKLIWQIPSADLACPDGVNFIDYSVLSKAWLSDPNLPNWDPNTDISEPNDLVINIYDLDVFNDQWLTGIRN